MLAKFHASLLSTVLVLWSTLVAAQTAGTTSPGTTPPAGTAADADGLNWVWIALVVIVVAGALYYFLGRRRGTRV